MKQYPFGSKNYKFRPVDTPKGQFLRITEINERCLAQLHDLVLICGTFELKLACQEPNFWPGT